MLEKALYIVATPIGNLEDISERAKTILKSVDIIAAEDTRHSHQLLSLLGIQSKSPLLSFHDHNETERTKLLISYLEEKKSIALVSDAGTPLISDPGYHLVKTVREQGYKVIPIPGCCALIAALSVSGLPTDRFCFEGFLPAKTSAKKKCLELLKEEQRTLVFYESPHRILDTLKMCINVFGEDREAVLARELTKKFETIHANNLKHILEFCNASANEQKGEFVLLIHGYKDNVDKTINEAMVDDIPPEAKNTINILLTELSIKQATQLAAKITGIQKRKLYDYALKINNK